MRLAIQLYTLRNLDESLSETVARLADTPYEGVQFAGLGEDPVGDVAAALEEAGLDVAGAHVGVDDIEDDYDDVRENYGRLGCEALVVSSYDHDAFETAEGARGAGEHLSTLADRVAGDEFGLHYHNHTFEFTTLDGQTAYDAFAAAADGVDLEIDTGLANHAGVDPVELLETYGDRASLVHLTDSRPGSDDTLHMDLGTGEVDIEGCVDAAREAGVEWLIFEHGLTDDPLASATDAAETLAPLLR